MIDVSDVATTKLDLWGKKKFPGISQDLVLITTAVGPVACNAEMGILLNINSGVLAGVMIAVYELVLLPVIDWSLRSIVKLLNVRSLTRYGVGGVYESPLPFSSTPHVFVRKRDSWLVYLIRLLPFGLVTAWGFLVNTETVLRTETTLGRVMVPGNGAFRYAVNEQAVRRSAELEFFCQFHDDIHLRTAEGSCTTRKVFSDLGTDTNVTNLGSDDCDVTLEKINREVGGLVGHVLGVGRCEEGRYFGFWTNDEGSSQVAGQVFQIVGNRIYISQIQSEVYMSIQDAALRGKTRRSVRGELSGVYSSLKGVEVHFSGWDETEFVRAMMTNSYSSSMGSLKGVTAALLVPRNNVTVEVIGETVVLTKVSDVMIGVTFGLVVVVVILCGVGLTCEFHRRKRYMLNSVSGALEVASLAVAGSNNGRIVKAKITATRWNEKESGIVRQTLESWGTRVTGTEDDE